MFPDIPVVEVPDHSYPYFMLLVAVGKVRIKRVQQYNLLTSNLVLLVQSWGSQVPEAFLGSVLGSSEYPSGVGPELVQSPC